MPLSSAALFSCVLQVCRGTAVTMVAPTAGAEEIANPFMQAAEEQ
jgi:hypothetical protein